MQKQEAVRTKVTFVVDVVSYTRRDLPLF